MLAAETALKGIARNRGLRCEPALAIIQIYTFADLLAPLFPPGIVERLPTATGVRDPAGLG